MSTPTTTISGMAPVRIKSKLKCAVIGDSLLWGQGLKLERKFCHLAAEKLAKLAGKTFSPVEMLAHSGAQLAIPPVVGRAQHYAFTELFPELFAGIKDTKLFIGGNDRAAGELYHEIPAAFPLIPTQLKMLGDGPRPDIDLLFLNGGADDVDFKKVLDPEGPDMLHIHAEIRHLIYYPLRHLLVKARSKCPNALIVVPSYYPLMSTTATHDNPVVNFIKWFAGLNPKLADAELLAWAGVATGAFPFTGSVLWKLDKANEEIERSARDMKRRIEIAFPLSQFWIARAVAEAREREGVRGPGIVFVNPRFTAYNTLFASDSFVYGNYDPPEDPLVDVRMERDPRGDLEDALKALLGALGFKPFFGPAVERAKKAVELLGGLTGPQPLRHALDQQDVLVNEEKKGKLIDLLKIELLRLRLVRIASMMHPNDRGAKRYADRIVEDVRTYQYEDSKSTFDSMVTGLRRMISEPLPTPEEALRAYGLDPDAPRGENMQLMRPDIVTFVIHGVKPPPGERWANLRLHNVEGGNQVWAVGLTMLRQPNEDTTVLTGDAGGRFRLANYKRCWIDISGWILGQHRVEMFVNGRRVLDTEVTTFIGATLKLPYPAPIPAPLPINPSS